MFKVYVREYAGDGYWYDYPPLEFDTVLEAEEFVNKIEMNDNCKCERNY